MIIKVAKPTGPVEERSQVSIWIDISYFPRLDEYGFENENKKGIYL